MAGDARTRAVIAAAVTAAVTAALAEEPEGLASAPPSTSDPAKLPPWVSVADYAAHIGKAQKTIRAWAQRAPSALAVRYGRDWRLAGPAFDAWARRGGPFREAASAS